MGKLTTEMGGSRAWTSWPDVLWSYQALYDPEGAVGLLQAQLATQPYAVEQGETAAHTYSWLHSLSVLGQHTQGAVTADTPLYAVFDSARSGMRTYVATNGGDSPVLVSFSDSTKVSIPAKATGWWSRKLGAATSGRLLQATGATGPLFSSGYIVDSGAPDATTTMVSPVSASTTAVDPSPMPASSPSSSPIAPSPASSPAAPSPASSYGSTATATPSPPVAASQAAGSSSPTPSPAPTVVNHTRTDFWFESAQPPYVVTCPAACTNSSTGLLVVGPIVLTGVDGYSSGQQPVAAAPPAATPAGFQPTSHVTAAAIGALVGGIALGVACTLLAVLAIRKRREQQTKQVAIASNPLAGTPSAASVAGSARASGASSSVAPLGVSTGSNRTGRRSQQPVPSLLPGGSQELRDITPAASSVDPSGNRLMSPPAVGVPNPLHSATPTAALAPEGSGLARLPSDPADAGTARSTEELVARDDSGRGKRSRVTLPPAPTL